MQCVFEAMCVRLDVFVCDFLPCNFKSSALRPSKIFSIDVGTEVSKALFHLGFMKTDTEGKAVL